MRLFRPRRTHSHPVRSRSVPAHGNPSGTIPRSSTLGTRESTDRTTPRSRVLDAWIWGCAAFLLLSVASRALRFLPVRFPASLDSALGEVMIFHFILILNTKLWITAHVFAVVLLGAGLCLLTRGFFRIDAGQVVLRGWFTALLWFELAVHNAVLDLDPGLLALYCATVPLGLAWVSDGASRKLDRKWRVVLLGAGALLLALWLGTHESRLHLVQLLLWTVGVVALLSGRRRFSRRRDRVAALLVVVFAVQLGSLGLGALPAWLLGNGGRLLGAGTAYSFCEIPERQSLFAVRTSCSAEDIEDCRGDYVAEYDLRTLSETRKHHFFDNGFHGRMLHLLCLSDRVQVGMSETVDGLWRASQNVLEFPVESPWEVVRHLLPEPVGVVMLHDPGRREIYYCSEFSNDIVRLDYGGTQPSREMFSLREAREFPPPYMLGPFFLRAPGSLSTMPNARYEARGTGFFAEWIRGRKVMELDLASRRVVREYRTNNGGNSCVSVDETLGRLFVNGLWGVEVFDLETGDLLLRRRTEFAPRLPIVDSAHGLIYVTTTFGNHIEVWDRRTLEVRGFLPVGAGGRNALLSSDGRYLFSSAFGDHYAWETEALGRRFGGAGSK